jgi:hypothetical protein
MKLSPRLWLAVALVGFGSAQVALIGAGRAVTGSLDLAAPYAGSAAWIRGLDPYNGQVLAKVLSDAHREADADPPFTPAVYPPATFVALLPLTVFDWPAARLVWLGLNVVLLGFAARALVTVANVRHQDGLLIFGGIIALGPWATGIALGQLAVASIALIALGIERLSSGEHRSASALLGVALLLKPQLAAFFVIYWIVRGPRRPALAASILYALASAIAIGVLEVRGVDWAASWRANGNLELGAGNMDPAGALSAQMVDLRPLLSAFFDVRASVWVGLLASAVGMALLLAILRAGPATDELLSLSCVAVFTLLGGYHRFYDAALLCIPAAWAIREVTSGKRKLGAIVLVLLAPFMVSGAWTLQRLGAEGSIPVETDGFVWNALVLRHQNWAILALAVLLLVTARSRRVRAVRLTAGA